MSNIKTIKDNSSWIITDNQDKIKIGSIVKTASNEYEVVYNNVIHVFSKKELLKNFGNTLFQEAAVFKRVTNDPVNTLHGYQANQTPYNAMYDVKHKVPIYTKEPKSKSFFCAGYYLINTNKGWQEQYCPKLITLQKYKYHGPFASNQKLSAFAKKFLHNEHNTY